MPTLNLEIKNNSYISYPIYIYENLFDDENLFNSTIKNKQIAIITNKTIAPLYLEEIKSILKNKEIITIILEDGEKYKNLNSFSLILDELIKNHFGRDCALIALGGGVIGDLTGFAASAYQRGVDFYQIPTTLLSQVDSSVGGKTGLNHPKGKNMIGAFFQPQAVFIDPKTLKTLSAREFASGLGEVIKYGLINDENFFLWLEENIEKIMQKEGEVLSTMIAHCCQNKANIVAEDEKEQGKRALLNLGHSFGHALESLTNYEHFKHGEAVSIGIKMALQLAVIEKKITENQKDRAINLFKKANLPYELENNLLKPQDIYQAMFLDKKVRNKKLRLITFKGFCDCELRDDFTETDILKAIEFSIGSEA